MNKPVGLFAAAEVGNQINKDTYEAAVEQLRVDLINLQYDLRERDFSVVLLIAGDDRPGAVRLMRTLHEWMDARYIRNHVSFGVDQSENAERPVLGRYWRRLPAKGQIGLFLGGWPTSTVRLALEEDWSKEKLDAALDHLSRFEQQLAVDGALVLKFWLHLPQAILKKRMQAAREDPQAHWDFAQHDWEVFDRDGKAFELIERMLVRTNSTETPWHILESTDHRYFQLTAGQQIARQLENRLAQKEVEHTLQPYKGVLTGLSLLSQIDLSAKVSKDVYERKLDALQARINGLAYQLHAAGIPVVLVFEGVDAAGKGGSIRRLVKALPVQHVQVIPIGAPNSAEQAHHYMWRFWTRLPTPGKVVVFDRSWYGRVLVERVEGFATVDEWQRAYDEINDFEATLHDNGYLLAKFWLQIDADEQLKRFQARSKTPYKKYKLTPDDFRNRENWDAYQVAAHDMVARTSTQYAPWHLVAANDKRHARLHVLEVVAELMESRLAQSGSG